MAERHCGDSLTRRNACYFSALTAEYRRISASVGFYSRRLFTAYMNRANRATTTMTATIVVDVEVFGACLARTDSTLRA